MAKTHSPSKFGKTLCGKNSAKVRTTIERPGCRVCNIVFQKKVRPHLRLMAKQISAEAYSRLNREKNQSFAEGMVFALVQIVHENPACARDARSVFDAAGLTRDDFKDTGISYDYDALNKILEV